MKILIDEEVVKQVLDVLLDIRDFRPHDRCNKAITALRSALDAAEKVEPVAEMTRGWPYPSDEELLKLAAKAAGYEWRKDVAEFRDDRGILGLWIVDPMMTGWNPLTDDGDALRLAVKLKIEMYFTSAYVIARNTDDNNPVDMYDNDPYAATRRAIVRAAAEIGKGMK